MKIEKEFGEDTLEIEEFWVNNAFCGWKIHAFLGVGFTCTVIYPERNIRDAFKTMLDLRELENEWASGVTKLNDGLINLLLDNWQLYDELTEMRVISEDGSEFCHPRETRLKFAYKWGYDIANAIEKRRRDVLQAKSDARELINGRYRDVDENGKEIWRSVDEPVEFNDEKTEINATQDGADTHDH